MTLEDARARSIIGAASASRLVWAVAIPAFTIGSWIDARSVSASDRCPIDIDILSPFGPWLEWSWSAMKMWDEDAANRQCPTRTPVLRGPSRLPLL